MAADDGHGMSILLRSLDFGFGCRKLDSDKNEGASNNLPTSGREQLATSVTKRILASNLLIPPTWEVSDGGEALLEP